ncbi:hypothetical protein NA56DRAFT_17137 [Hyaloscypha hepaticicola]|uniref:Uncharacterized protein n=1 Tax=Hyaloscypha hepaticicola TaxID=2082293 RepID=A0A2J6QQK8_9HELO|nr:hypothetical protein NA56DRAFT_17137 [Hyaloscypha hepaticicola]
MSSRRPVDVAYLEDYDENNERVDRGKRQVANTKKSKAHREPRKPRISFSDAQYPGQSSSRDSPAVDEEKPVRVERRGSFGSDDSWGIDPPSTSYSCGETPPLRPNRASSENLNQDTLNLSMSQENADTAPDKKAQQTKIILARGDKGPEIRAVSPLEPIFSGGMMSTFTAVDAEPATRKSKRGSARPRKSKKQKQAEKDSAEAALAAIDAGEEPPSLSPAKDEPKIRIKLNTQDPKEPTTSGFTARLYRKFKGDSSSPSGLPPSSDENKLTSLNPSNITWGGTTILGSAKETVVSTPPRPTIVWGPTTVLGSTKSHPLDAIVTFPSRDLDSDGLEDDANIAVANAEALANDSDGFYGQEFGFYSAPAAGEAEYANGGYFGPRGRKQTSRGIQDPHVTNSELLEDAETYEQTPLQSGESKREAEFLLDEQSQQEEDEIRGPLVVPTVSNKKRWAGFDVDGHEHRGGSMGNAEPGFEAPTAKDRSDREDMLTPDWITYSTPLNSEDGDSDEDDAVLYPKASGVAIPSFPPRGYRQGIRDLGEKIAARNESADAYGGVPRPYVPDVPRLVPAAPVFNPISSVAAAYQAGKEDADAERYGIAERIVERPVQRIIERVIEQPRHVPVISHGRPEPRYAEPRFDDRYVDDLRREEDFLRHRDAEEYIEGRPAEITRLATILKSKQHWTNQHELAQDNGDGQSQPGTVSIATAFKGQATDMLDESPKLPQSRPIEDERDTGLLLDDEPLPPPPFYRSLRSENQRGRKRQASPTPSVESLQCRLERSLCGTNCPNFGCKIQEEFGYSFETFRS